MPMTTPFYRVRWTLQARSAWSLHSHQEAILYALLCDAARGAATDRPWQMPSGLLLDAPERCRDRYEPGETFAFGATLAEPDADEAHRTLHDLCGGLVRLGRIAPPRPVALGGNFDLVDVRDLVAGKPVNPGGAFQSLELDTVGREIERLLPRLGEPITLRFLSPLRLERPGENAESGHRFADRGSLDAAQLLRTIQKRMAKIGMRRTGGNNPPFDDSVITLIDNYLTWLDLGYGRIDHRKSLGGALGRVKVAVHDPVALVALIWGQYTRVGRNLQFGFGRYRIEELGDDPTECARSTSLIELCVQPAAIALAAAHHNISERELNDAAERLKRGTYEPGRSHRLTIHDSSGSPRELKIPPLQDRVLQRLILHRLGPAIDRLFETSSFAWRKGLSREAAARRIERLVRDGWQIALRADFDRFFDLVPRSLVKERLEAWVGDDKLSAAIMKFADERADNETGLPTGAPLSRLLGNLLLDHFDEAIEREGGRLVRYADDFLILTRDRVDADRLHARSHELAADLLLQLNSDSAVTDLSESFDFLGYRFRHEKRWQYTSPGGPIPVQDLDWKDANRNPSSLTLPLPNECADALPTGVIVVGPGIDHLDVSGETLKLRGPEQVDHVDVPLTGIEQLILIGPTSWSADAAGKLLRAGLPVLLVSAGGWPLGELQAETPDNPEALIAQARAATEPALALELARPLVRAKLRNFATLAETLDGPSSPTGSRLREFALDVESGKVESLDALRGIEGAGAACWYRLFPKLLNRGYLFHHRIAPDADDPVNVMLNIGHTMMHRHAIAACRAAGLSPSLGFLHQGDGRYAALAADLQEPFRHVVERAVILATRILRPSGFVKRDDGPHRLVLNHHASKAFHALLQRSWRTAVIGRGQTEPRAWLAQLLANARALRRRLNDPESPWEPFEHL